MWRSGKLLISQILMERSLDRSCQAMKVLEERSVVVLREMMGLDV